MENTCKEAIEELVKLIDLVKENPNDMILGSKVREFVNKIEDREKKIK